MAVRVSMDVPLVGKHRHLLYPQRVGGGTMTEWVGFAVIVLVLILVMVLPEDMFP